jgi:AraC family transcriptional regulator, L-rhamnose operon regulatory protein RhaS
MKRYRQLAPVMISDFAVERWHHPVHNHNHYELIYIKSGKGWHTIDGGRVAYKAGDVFLLGPDDAHAFKIDTRTRFIYLKFTDQFIHQQGATATPGVQSLEYLIKRRDAQLSGFALPAEDRRTVAAIFTVVSSLQHDVARAEPIVWTQVLALAMILQRNLPELTAATRPERDMQAMFCYIHKYIYTPDKLRAGTMASHFNTTPDYIGPYFKRHAGVTLRDYVRDYRGGLIRKRIESGQYSLKSIAAEFGLTDESHVRKLAVGG